MDCKKVITEKEYDERHRCEKCEKIHQHKQTPEGMAEEAAKDIEQGLKTATLIGKEILNGLNENPELVEVIKEMGEEIFVPIINAIQQRGMKQDETRCVQRTNTYLQVVKEIQAQLKCDIDSAMVAANAIMQYPNIQA